MNTLALRQFLFSISRNRQLLKYGAAAGAGAVGYAGVKKIYDDITSPFKVKISENSSINLFPIILIILVIIILKKKKVI